VGVSRAGQFCCRVRLSITGAAWTAHALPTTRLSLYGFRRWHLGCQPSLHSAQESLRCLDSLHSVCGETHSSLHAIHAIAIIVQASSDLHAAGRLGSIGHANMVAHDGWGHLGRAVPQWRSSCMTTWRYGAACEMFDRILENMQIQNPISHLA